MPAPVNWLAETARAASVGCCLDLEDGPLAGCGLALALAPHPDDPDAVAVLLRALADGGWHLHWAVLTSGWSGVEDAFAGPGRAAKAAVREAEEQTAARRFGLAPAALEFLRLAEGADGHLVDDAANRAAVERCLADRRPGLVVIPYHDDSNPSHRLAAHWCLGWAARQPAGAAPVVLEAEDPKSAGFQPTLRLLFGEERAQWKAELLECHASQSARNRRQRGISFAERILGVNRTGAADHPGFYAERFRTSRPAEGRA